MKGKTVAITRSARDAREFSELARAAGAEPLPLPTIKLVARGGIAAEFVKAAEGYDPDHTIFMSSRAVSLLFDAAESEGVRDALRSAVANTSVVAVGPVTRAALSGRGVRTARMPETYSSIGIGELFSRIGGMMALPPPMRENSSRMPETYSSIGIGELFSRIGGGRAIIPRSGASTPFLKELLEKIGVSVKETVLYDVRACPDSPEWSSFRAMLPRGGIDGLVFTSASSVRAFFEIMGRAGGPPGLEKTRVVSIGPFTSSELEKFGVRHSSAGVHTVPGAFEELRRQLCPDSTPPEPPRGNPR